MSSYFDTFDREVRALSDSLKNDQGEFVKKLYEIEGGVITDCVIFATDYETPPDIRDKISSVITNYQVRPDEDCSGTRMAMVSRKSQLSSEMHSLFHEIASKRIKTRYTGFVNDNPGHLARMILADSDKESD